MQSHQKSHVKVLEKIQMGSTQVSGASSPNQDRLALEVEKLWTSTTKKFEEGSLTFRCVLHSGNLIIFSPSAFNEQKLTLKSDANQRMDKSGPREKFNVAIQIQVTHIHQP